ncbi:sodium hydrogen exchanger family protein, putative [Ichthyophthirius multifiliis]|uniref:Sodium hydrogen exchanger family protein, putative n=1 Tax=Ichthyophthirius multifiliis TaxID=5932 RepID=G0QYU7_ICHMU|nr:sodium hydrogen exchanger family protein, putative [Ichthyophthirius multifiliis]EGR29622.1 sodium hydrogen exchanger family protein, putative [Ichthyophthirius multifiliis]|eukprot:XP_004030858.1 sodium hydrogen exchanger family protein, putative [Ichthyophthirius multifiliis]
MAGSATLTLLINGTTCGAQLIIYSLFKQHLQNTCVDKEKELRTNNFFALTDWDKVYQISGMEDFRNKLFEGKPEVTLGRKSTYSSFNEPEILQELRFRYLRGLKSLCWEQYENRYIGSGAAKWLEEGLNMALDDLTVPLKTWDMTYMNFTGFKILKMMFYMRNTPVIGKIARNYITNHLSFVYEVTTSFIVISHEIQEHNHELPISKDYTHVMNQEMNQNIVQAEKYIAELAYNFPELIKTIHTKRASYNIIEAQKKFLLQYKDSGYIDNTDYNILRSEVDQRTLSLQNMAFDWTIPTLQNFLLEFPIFSTLTPEQISLIRASFTQKSLSAGTEIYQKGQPFQGIYFVTQGSVDDKVTGDISLNIGIGGFQVLQIAFVKMKNNLIQLQQLILTVFQIRFLLSYKKYNERKQKL